MMQPHWENRRWLLKMLNRDWLHQPAILLPTIVCPGEIKTHVYTKTYIHVFRASLFTLAMKQKKTQMSIKRNVNSHIMEYYLAIKRN